MKSAKLWNISLLMSLTLILSVSCSSKKNDKTSKKVSLYLSEGASNLMNKEYTEALKNLSIAHELDPNNSDVLNNLGMAYYFKHEKDLAIIHLKKAIDLDKKNSDARLNLASIYYREGKLKEAENLYHEATKNLTYDKLPLAYYNLGLLELEKKKNFKKAEFYFKKSIQEDENYCPAYFKLGVMKYEKQKFNSALKYFKEASMGICYEIPEPVFYQALTLIKLRKYDEARLKLDLIETKFKNSPYALKARSEIQKIDGMKNQLSTDSPLTTKLLESAEF